MAICEVCGKNLGFFGGNSLENRIPNVHISLGSITVCDNCLDIMNKLREGDENAYYTVHNAIDSSSSENLKSFVSKWEKVPPAVAKKKEQERDQAEIERRARIAFEEQEKTKQRQIEMENQARLAERQKEIEAVLPQLRNSFLSTTGNNFEGYKISKYLGIKSGEIVLGTGFFSELSASISDFFGNGDYVMGYKITQAKSAALSALIDNCIFSEANAVLGVDIDFMTIGANMIVACANGTAVVIEKL